MIALSPACSGALVLTLCLGLAACTARRATEAPITMEPSAAAAQVTAVADEYMGARLEHFPETATYYGLPDALHDRLTDNSLAAMRAWEAREDGWLEQLQQLDARALAERPERVTYAILLETLESSRQTRVCRGELWPVNQMFGWQTIYPFLAQIQPVGSADLRAQTLARWRAIPRYLDTEIENARQGLREGYSTPRISVERVIAQLDGLLEPPPAESPFYGPAQRDRDAAFGRALRQVISEEINPAVTRYRDFLRDEYLPAAREAVAVSSLPDGTACYRATVRGFTTLDVPPREIHRLGLRQMAQIQAEMRQIAERSFNTSDVQGLLQRFRTDPQYTFGSREEIIALAREAVERGKREMPNWFGILPQSDVVVEPYPEFQEASAPGGEYINPADDGSRPAIYRINTYQPERQSRVGLESTAFHEAIPGHHLQVAIGQEREGAHPLTRFLFNSGFAEGWALYSERLADEMGLFSSDLDRMGLLSNEALRAARLVVDPGVHVLGWSRQQAIDYMLQHTAESPESVATEVDRYIVMPGQATAYMIGSLEIQRLREMAERALGPRFDIRTFHDKVLEDGSVTLLMLREKIERWIAESER